MGQGVQDSKSRLCRSLALSIQKPDATRLELENDGPAPYRSVIRRRENLLGKFFQPFDPISAHHQRLSGMTTTSHQPPYRISPSDVESHRTISVSGSLRSVIFVQRKSSRSGLAKD